ncbi:MAG: hypothetical protein Fur009_0840 [Candidatus Microgenomates bacterium]
MNILNTWPFNILVYLFSIVIFNQFYKLAVRDAKNDGAATILLQVIASFFCLFLVPFFSFKFPLNLKPYFLLILASIFYALNDRLQTTSRKHIEVSVFSIISQLSNVFLILIGLIFFKEKFFLNKIIGAALILFANIFLFYKKGRFELNKYTLIGVLATFIFSLALSIDIGISKQFNLPFYIMLTLFIPSLMIFFAEKIKVKDLINELETKNKKYYFITGLFWSLAIFFSLRLYQFGKVTIITPLQATSVILNILVAYIFLNEKSNRVKKIIAAILVFFGIWLIVYK